MPAGRGYGPSRNTRCKGASKMLRTRKDGKGNAGAAVLGKYCRRTKKKKGAELTAARPSR